MTTVAGMIFFKTFETAWILVDLVYLAGLISLDANFGMDGKLGV